jgi:DNA-binding HxlR family transcriptional regulator
MRRTGRRSYCPINYGLEAFGDAWSLLVIRDLMFQGKHTYTDFLRSEERIATNILADRLRRLEKAGLIRRRAPATGAAYALTEKGLGLLPMLAELVLWSANYDRRTAADPTFVARLRSDRSGLLEEIRARLRRSHGLPDREAPSAIP